MKEQRRKKPRSLFQQFKSYYMTNVLLPYILVAVLSLSSFSVSSRLIQDRLVSNMTDYINLELKTIAGLEAQTIEQQLSEVGNLTELYGLQVQRALQAGGAGMDAADAARMRYSDDGTYYTIADRPDGGAAVFYSGLFPVGEAERAKAAKVLGLQYLMKHINQSCPMAISLYLNTYDSLNIIYPYFDVMKQFTPGIDITRFNFYYEADAVRNPSREVRWTGVYLDPAGHGWMTSAIYPVYSGDFLEGVVGIDVTVSAITGHMLDIDIPWGGYGILVSDDGSILALPESGEVDWGLHELTDHDYQQAVTSDTLKPEDFNIYKMPEHADFSSALSSRQQGFSTVNLNGKAYAVSWNTIRLTGWKLVFLIPESRIEVQVNRLVDQQMRIGLTSAVVLIAFLLLLLFYLSFRSRRESRFYSSQLARANDIIESIGRGEYVQRAPEFGILELQQTAYAINEMGKKLEAAQQSITATNNELLSAKNAAERASSAKSEFLSGMSHELRTPLNAVLGFSQLLLMDEGSLLNAEQAEFVGEINKAGKLLLRLINDVLDLAKIETGKIEIALEIVQLSGLLSEVYSLMKPMADQYGIELAPCADSCMLTNIIADPLRTKQVIINVVSNAIKYNKKNGRVSISCVEIGRFIEVRVSDTGIGIPADQLDVIFEPFSRLSATRNNVEGTGIGLYMVKQLLARMGGSVGVVSEEGVGSMFVISLPVAPADDPDDPDGADDPGEGESAAQVTDGKAVLYIEDNPANLSLVVSIIRRLDGVRLITADRGLSGIEAANACLPALILIDISLPDIDGFEVLARLRHNPRLSRTKMVAVSANAMRSDIERGKQRGFDDYVIKPIDIDNFLRVVARFVDI